jgi:hypothetical protein
MYCSKCGAEIPESDKFCARCGNATSTGGSGEKELYSFGPMGVEICSKRPSMFALMTKNMTKITVTNQRIYGSPKGSFVPTRLLPFKNSAEFSVPIDSIQAIERVGLGFWKGFWVQYQDGNESHEISVLCSPSNRRDAEKAYTLLQQAKPSTS